jgi:lipoxygenase homology domain-containing protein 1
MGFLSILTVLNIGGGAVDYTKPAQACSKALSRRCRFYQRHKVPWPAPSDEQLAALAPVEDAMRATLSSLASFNETERMVLLKQFSFQEKVARQQARAQGLQIYAPQGLLSISQFIAAWHNLSIKLTKQDARAFFFKYGCDSEGLLPYEVFAMHLLSGQSRLLALAPELTGPYAQGGHITMNSCLWDSLSAFSRLT